MGRIFLSAGHGGPSNAYDPGAVVGGTTEAEQMIMLRDRIISELRSRGFELLSVPDDLTLRQTIDWINARARAGDVALEIHGDSYSNPDVRGASCFYIANNSERKNHAEQMLLALLRRLPALPSRGAKPDTATGVGSLGFCRQVVLPSLLLEVGFLSNPEDRSIILNQRQAMAKGIADGLVGFSNAITGNDDGSNSGNDSNAVYPTINIKINGQLYQGKGILVNSNSYIPIDLADQLGVDLTQDPTIRLIQYQGVVYVKAIELRDHNVSVGWESDTRSVTLRSILKICSGVIDKIMGHGNTTEVQMTMFLQSNHPNSVKIFPDLAKIYREEAEIEGVNYDIAFCQMCVETSFLRFGDNVKPSQNNFASLGTASGSESATFPSARIGVRAQVQHLKAYASLEPLIQTVVDPRFRFVTRGVAPLVGQLSGRWAADLQYGEKIISTVRLLYESAKLL